MSVHLGVNLVQVVEMMIMMYSVTLLGVTSVEPGMPTASQPRLDLLGLGLLFSYLLRVDLS